MIAAPVDEAGPARTVAVGGAAWSWPPSTGWNELGVVAEPLHTGKAGTLMRASRLLQRGRCGRCAVRPVAAG